MSRPNLSRIRGFQFTAKQKVAYSHVGRGKRIFYGGRRGGGKSQFAFSSACLVAEQFPGITVYIIRSTLPEIEKYFIPRLIDTIPSQLYRYNRKENVATWYNRSRIYFVPIPDEASTVRIKGAECQYMIIDEANELLEIVIYKCLGSLRRAKNNPDLEHFEPTLVMTGNPGGISDHWFKDRFIYPNYERWHKEELKHKDDYIFIESGVDDNPYLGDDYTSNLKAMPDHLRKAWLDGDWNVFSGRFFEEWNEDVHVIQGFYIPEHWLKYRGIDQGHTGSAGHPSICLWAAQVPKDEEVQNYDGTKRKVREGEVYFYREYVSEDKSIEAMINGVLAHSPEGEHIAATYADPAMFNSSFRETVSSQSSDRMYMQAGIPLTRADNNRFDGWAVMKTWLHWGEDKVTKEKFMPYCYFFEECLYSRETIPTIRYSTSTSRGKAGDADTKGRDDAADTARYILKTAFPFPNMQIIEDPVEKEKIQLTFRERELEDELTPYYNGESVAALYF